MKKYKFYNVIFTPDEYHQIKFDGKKVHLSPLQSKLLTYFEMLQTPEGDTPIYHVIVTPNDGDVAARRTDVKTIMLSYH